MYPCKCNSRVFESIRLFSSFKRDFNIPLFLIINLTFWGCQSRTKNETIFNFRLKIWYFQGHRSLTVLEKERWCFIFEHVRSFFVLKQFRDYLDHWFGMRLKSFAYPDMRIRCVGVQRWRITCCQSLRWEYFRCFYIYIYISWIIPSFH